MKYVLPCFLSLSILISGGSAGYAHQNGRLQAVECFADQVVQNETGRGIQVVAKRPYIKRGEIGVLALKCTPGSKCNIIANYKINGLEYRAVRNLVAGRDGNVLCTWMVDEKTDTGTYNIEIISGTDRLVTTYNVQ
jgi:hypothetical protein